MKKKLPLITLLTFLVSFFSASGQTFSYTGGIQTFNVTTSGCIKVKAWGGGGGGGGSDVAGNGGSGGGGAYAEKMINVNPGDVLQIYVGGGGTGGWGCVAGTGAGTGGWGYGSGGNGGNAGWSGCSGGGGAGSGSSSVLLNGVAVLVAAGGGGGGGCGCSSIGADGGSGGADGATASPPGLGGLVGANGVANGAVGLDRGNGDGAGGGGGGGGWNGGAGGDVTSQGGSDCGYGGGAGGGGGGNSLGTTIINGSGPTPGNNADPDLCVGCAAGGISQGIGGNGIVVFTNGTGTSQSFTICPGDSVQLPDGTWANSAGVYADTLVNQWGCDSIITATVTVTNFVPNAGNAVTICQGDTAQLQASGGVSYNWSPANSLSNANISNPLAHPSSTTTYTVTATDLNGCTGSDQITVTINATSGTAGPDVQICNGDTIQMNASGGTSYSWSPAISLSNSNIANPEAFPGTTTTYTVTITNANGCVVTDTVTVTISTALNGQVTPNDSICVGGILQLNASGGTTYIWSPAAGLSCVNCPDPLADPFVSTTYTVVISTGNCTDTLSTTVTVDYVNLGISDDTIIAPGGMAQLNASGAYTYSWQPTESLDESNISDPVATPTVTTTYTVYGVTVNGCTDSAVVTVIVTDATGIEIANAFTPNGDGINDIIKLMPLGDYQLQDFKIFNRWGEVVFETDDLYQGWDGTYRDDPQEVGVYVYFAQATDRHTGQKIMLKGNITLLR